MEVLGIVNLFLIFSIVFFLVFYVIKNRLDKIEFQRKMNDFSLLDLKELNNINPIVKEAYKKYVADKVMTAIVNSLNANISSMEIDRYLKENDAKIAVLVDQIVDSIKVVSPVITKQQFQSWLVSTTASPATTTPTTAPSTTVVPTTVTPSTTASTTIVTPPITLAH